MMMDETLRRKKLRSQSINRWVIYMVSIEILITSTNTAYWMLSNLFRVVMGQKGDYMNRAQEKQRS